MTKLHASRLDWLQSGNLWKRHPDVFQYAKANMRFRLCSQNQALTRPVLAGHPWPARMLW